MKLALNLVTAAAFVLATTITIGTVNAQCGGCSDPCVSSPCVTGVAGGGCGSSVAISSGCGGAVGCGQGYVVSSGMPMSSETVSSIATAPTPSVEPICEPITNYKVVMKPTYETETRMVSTMETRTETR
ncbi:MAG: hypothetical protein AAF539_00540, partial [Planctomycetota bacterium]